MRLLTTLLLLSVFALDEVEAGGMFDGTELHPFGYSQVGYTTKEESFSMDNVRVFLEGKCRMTDFLVELKLNQPEILVKAQLSWQFSPSTIVVLGQQSNPFKFYYPSPHSSPTIYTPYGKLIPTADDIGLAVKGKVNVIGYHLCLFNGAGKNRADDNACKDFVARLQFSPWKSLSLGGCYQGGEQPTGWREGRVLDAAYEPIKGLNLKGAYLHRLDLDQEGWFGMVSYRFRWCEVLTQVIGGSERGMTMGINMYHNESLKVQADYVIPEEGEAELAMRCQLFVH